MSYHAEILSLAKLLNEDLSTLGATQRETPYVSVEVSEFDLVITNRALRAKTEKLFKDGHYARAVEESYKLLDNLVKKQAGLSGSSLTGAPLMESVFSANNPKLRLNTGISTSEKDEQKGYMMVFAGCMTGIRNPRAHESDWEDTEERALQLLTFANHLIERTLLATKQTAST